MNFQILVVIVMVYRTLKAVLDGDHLHDSVDIILICAFFIVKIR